MRLSSLLVILGLSLSQLATFDDACTYHLPEEVGSLRNCAKANVHYYKITEPDSENNKYYTLWSTEFHFGIKAREEEQVLIRAPYNRPYAETLQVPIGDVKKITKVTNDCGVWDLTFHWDELYGDGNESWTVESPCLEGNCYQGGGSRNPAGIERPKG